MEVWASVASWFMRSPEAGTRTAPPRSPQQFPAAPTICTSIRCTVPGCPCDCFNPGKAHVRYCETCTHAWVPHALDKLGIGVGVEPVQASLAFDIASLVLYGCQALPIRLKILLDRLFSVLQREEVSQILRGFGWTHEDYARGYIMQEQGSVLDRWNICSAEEEPLVLQQFLRFGETRAIAQQLLMHVMGDPRYLPRVEADMKKFMDRLRPPPPLPKEPKARPPLSPKQLPPPAFPKPPPLSPPPAPVAASPLNRLQSMQPFDFRKSSSSRSPEHSPPAGLNLSVSSPTGRMSGRSRTPEMHPMGSIEPPTDDDDDDSENSQSALNLSKDAPVKGRPPLGRKPPTPVKRQWGPSIPPNLGTQLINPTTGKKRVQCNVCLKTFCDKGALKIHFSAVHLREMHKCTVEGCNMMFSSRRSRNRHSANPNPKLHSPHLRRKISPHDGRTAQNHPIILPQLAQSLNPLTFGTFGSLLTPPTDLRPPLDLKQSLDLSVMKHDDYRKDSSEHDYMDDEDEEGIVVEDTEDFDPSKSKRAKMSESDEGDDEMVSNMDSNEDSLSVVDSQSAREDNGPENLVTKSSRKRKNQNPTKCALPPAPRINGEVQSDESSNEMMYHKSLDHAHEEVSEDLSMKKEVKTENNNILDKKSPPPSDTVVNYSLNNNMDDCKDDPSDLSMKSRRDSPEKSMSDKVEVKSEDGIDSTNALRRLESLSQGHFGDLGKGQESSQEAGSYYPPSYLNNEPPSPARSHSSTGSSGDSDDLGYSDGIFDNIPIDKDNPRMCTACGKVFQNHFGVKTHYQNVHLKLMHKCTVDGCNAAFPSKRSRDRHSANLNLHRKLLSTPISDKAMFLESHLGGLNPSLHGEFLARLYGEQGMLPPPGLDVPPPFFPHLAGFLPRFAPNGSSESPAVSPGAVNLILDDDLPSPDKDGLLPCRFCQTSSKDASVLREHLESKHSSDLARCSFPGCSLAFLSASRRALHLQEHSKPSS